MADTNISWTQRVWNPTTGCDRVSDGCDNCYAMTMAKRLKGMGSAKYQNDGDPRTSGPGFGITEHPDAIDAPLRWRKPTKVFVNSMSDLFHDGVSDDFIAQVFAVMAMAPLHTFQVLTKRHGRMRSLLTSVAFWRMVGAAGRTIALDRAEGSYPASGPMRLTAESDPMQWETVQPLPNVWLGVSVEDQKRADLRIPALLDTPATVRFLSCEPLLGPVDLDRCLYKHVLGRDEHGSRAVPALHWVICGGESGKTHREMDLDAVESLVAQCRAASIPVWVKQDSGPRPGMQGRIPNRWWIKEFPHA